MLHFTLRVATENDESCQIALEAGILDMLLRIYVIFPSFSQAAIDKPEPWVPLRDICRKILLSLSQFRNHHNTVLSHPVSILWNECRPLPPPYSLQKPPLGDDLRNRAVAWRKAPRSCVKRRITTIYIGCLWRSNVYPIEDMEACSDIVELVRLAPFYSAICGFTYNLDSSRTDGHSTTRRL